MKVQILSDLRLESPNSYDLYEIISKAPCLALLGDVGYVALHQNDMLSFLRRQLEQFQIVVFVAGNHEAWRSSWTDTLHILYNFEKEVREIHPIRNSWCSIGRAYELPGTDILILGCSLFSHVSSKVKKQWILASKTSTRLTIGMWLLITKLTSAMLSGSTLRLHNWKSVAMSIGS